MQKNNSEDYTFLDKKVKAEEFNIFFASFGKNTFELTQKSLPNNELTCPELSPHHCNNRNNIFRPQPVDVNTVILTIKSTHHQKPE